MLRYYNLSRRTNKSPINRVIESIYSELSSGPNSSFGYRYMHQKLRSKGLEVSRETEVPAQISHGISMDMTN